MFSKIEEFCKKRLGLLYSMFHFSDAYIFYWLIDCVKSFDSSAYSFSFYTQMFVYSFIFPRKVIPSNCWPKIVKLDLPWIGFFFLLMLFSLVYLTVLLVSPDVVYSQFWGCSKLSFRFVSFFFLLKYFLTQIQQTLFSILWISIFQLFFRM